MMKRSFTAAAFLLAAYAAIMSTPGVGAQLRQLFWPGGTVDAPGLAIQGTKSGFFVKGSQDIGVSIFGTEALSFGTDGTVGKVVTTGGEDLGAWRVASGTLSSAQVLALNATPVEVIPGPALGRAIVIESAQYHLDFNSAAYVAAAGEDLAVSIVGGAQANVCDNASCLVAAATADNFGIAFQTDSLLGETLQQTGAAQISMLVGEWITGDSPIHYSIRYRIVNANLGQ